MLEWNSISRTLKHSVLDQVCFPTFTKVCFSETFGSKRSKNFWRSFCWLNYLQQKALMKYFSWALFFHCFKQWLTASRRLPAIKTGLLPEVIAVELLINQIVQRMTLNQEMQLRVCEIKLFSWLKYQVHERWSYTTGTVKTLRPH